jgi:hypothetical protein
MSKMKNIFLSFLIVMLCIGMQNKLNAQAPQWSKIADFPEGGNIKDLARDNNGKIYALSGNSNIYYSSDNGLSWLQIEGTYAYWNVLDIEVDKSNGTLYVGTTGEGIYWTSNFGQTWQNENISTDPISGLHATFNSLGVKNDGNTIVGSDVNFTNTLIYCSTNGGASWTIHSPAPFGTALDLQYIAGGNLLAATEQGVFQSMNNGASWSAINTGISFMRTTSVCYKQSNGYLFAGTDLNNITLDSTNSGVYVSTNGGMSWTLSSSGITNHIVKALLIDSVTGNIYAGTEGGIFVSTNNGATWTSASINLESLSIASLTRNIAGFFCGSERSGLAFSPTPNNGWNYRNSGIFVNTINNFAMDSLGHFYLIDGDITGIYKKLSTTSSWQQADIGQLPSFFGQRIVDHNGILYATFSTLRNHPKKGVFKSVDDGTNWIDISSTIPIPAGIPFVIFDDVEVSDSVIYVNVQYRGLPSPTIFGEAFRSTDGGASWISIMQATGSRLSLLDIDLASNGDIYIGSILMTTEIQFLHSANGGNSFDTVALGSLLPTQSADLLIDKHDTLYVKYSNIIYQRNGINNWISLPNGGWDINSAYARYMTVYFDNNNSIYVSAREEGIYRSLDLINWNNISSGIPSLYISASDTTFVTLIDICFDINNVPYARTYYDDEGGNLLGIYKFGIPSTASIEPHDKFNLEEEIYPNPTSQSITVEFYLHEARKAEATIYNIEGKKVGSNSIDATNGKNLLNIDLKGLAAGMYSLLMIIDDKVSYTKFVKE